MWTICPHRSLPPTPQGADGAARHLAVGAALADCTRISLPALPDRLPETLAESQPKSQPKFLPGPLLGLCLDHAARLLRSPIPRAAHKKSGAEAPLKKPVPVASICCLCMMPVHDEKHVRQNNFYREYASPTRTRPLWRVTSRMGAYSRVETRLMGCRLYGVPLSAAARAVSKSDSLRTASFCRHI